MTIVIVDFSLLPFFYVLAGVANGVLSKALKAVIKQPRPPGSKKGGHGFPSSHAQSLFFFLTILLVKEAEEQALSMPLAYYCGYSPYLGLVISVCISVYAISAR